MHKTDERGDNSARLGKDGAPKSEMLPDGTRPDAKAELGATAAAKGDFRGQDAKAAADGDEAVDPRMADNLRADKLRTGGPEDRRGERSLDKDPAKAGEIDPRDIDPRDIDPRVFEGRLPGGADPRRARDERKGGEEMTVRAAGDRILQGMHGAPEPRVDAARGPELASRTLSEVVEKLADRILTSKPDAAGGPEVRIKLKSSTLEGAEISVRRDANGLTIKFETTSLDVARRLDGLRNQLQSHMEKRTSDSVNVKVDVADKDDGDTPGDGRSRNRKNPWEREQDDEDEA